MIISDILTASITVLIYRTVTHDSIKALQQCRNSGSFLFSPHSFKQFIQFGWSSKGKHFGKLEQFFAGQTL